MSHALRAVQPSTPEERAALETWVALNATMRAADETLCARLLRLEQSGKRRKMFVLRIHSRLNRIRRARERMDLVAEGDDDD